MRHWRRIGIVGFGSIGSALVRLLCSQHIAPAPVAVLIRPGRLRPEGIPSEIRVIGSLKELLALDLDVVVECAGQQAVADIAVPIAATGCDLVIVSTGALVDDGLRNELAEAARVSGARIHLPPGAVAGIDGLSALRINGLDDVIYTSVKPPHAWFGTPAEDVTDLGALREPTVIFEGSAREAAQRFPKNANIAATVALAGIGLDETRVRLVADPTRTENCGTIDARGASGWMSVRFGGPAVAGNARTSASTALSLGRALANAERTFVI